MCTTIHRILTALLLAYVGAHATAQQWHEWQPALAGSAIAFDSTRGGVLLFGSRRAMGNSVVTGDATWWFDGQRFNRLQPWNYPTARGMALLAHDAARGRTVLVGGYSASGQPLFDTWEHDGTTWWSAGTLVNPPATDGGAMAFHAGVGRIVLLAGTAGGGGTWHYDGTGWQPAATTSPPARNRAGLAYDQARQRVVMFGGSNATTSLSETWEYDGAVWQQRFPATTPFGGTAELAYDAARARIVLVDSARRYWEYDGVDWAQQTTVVQAPDGYRLMPGLAPASTYLIDADPVLARIGSSWLPVPATRRVPTVTSTAAAVDVRRGRFLLHGGETLASGETPLWAWQGDQWLQLLPTNGPSPRPDHGFVYDDVRDVAVLFGGEAGGAPLAETWEYTSGQWALRSFATAPAARTRPGFLWDPLRRRSVLFGGRAGTLSFGDTWSYEGTAWTALPPGGPPARSGHAFVYDAVNDRCVLFGGENGSTTFGDTWAFTSSGWQQLTTTGQPGPRVQPAMVYDPTRGVVVLSGGRLGTTTYADSWELRGTTWSPLPGPSPLLPHFGSVFVPDPNRGRCHLVGGSVWVQIWFYSGPFPLREHQVLLPDAMAQSHRHGTGCPGSAGVPSLAAAPGSMPMLGTTFALQLQNVPPTPGLSALAVGISSALWQGLPLPLPLDLIGLPGCHAWIAPATWLTAPVNGGSSTFAIALPGLPSLAGSRLVAQALTLDANAPNGLGAVSNAVIALAY